MLDIKDIQPRYTAYIMLLVIASHAI